MPSIYDLFGTDKDAEKNGVVVDYRGYGKFRIARAGGANNRFQQVVERKFRPHRRAIANQTMPEEEARRLTIEAFADTIVLGWEGVIGRDGKELPYTRDNCIKLLTEVPDLFDDLREQAVAFANFRKQEIETDAKN